MVSFAIMIFSCVFCIVNKDKTDKVFLAMLLSNILMLSDYILYTVKLYSYVDAKMINVDRCMKLLEIP